MHRKTMQLLFSWKKVSRNKIRDWRKKTLKNYFQSIHITMGYGMVFWWKIQVILSARKIVKTIKRLLWKYSKIIKVRIRRFKKKIEAISLKKVRKQKLIIS